MSPRTSVSTRFWLGVALPALVLVAFLLFLILATGQGREWAPAVMLLVSLVAVPATALANCWVLFVGWSSRTRLFIAGLAVPLYVASAMAVFVHGTSNLGNAGGAMLAPFFTIMSAAARHPLAAAGTWVLGMLALLVGARALDGHRGEPAP